MELFGCIRFLDLYGEFSTPQMSGLVEKGRYLITVICILCFSFTIQLFRLTSYRNSVHAVMLYMYVCTTLSTVLSLKNFNPILASTKRG